MTSSAAAASTDLAQPAGRRIEQQNTSNRCDKSQLLLDFELNKILEDKTLCVDVHVRDVLAAFAAPKAIAAPKAHEKKKDLQAID